MVLRIETPAVGLSMADDASTVVLEDRRRGAAWRLVSGRCGWRRAEDGPLLPLAGGTTRRAGDALVVTYPVDGGVVRHRWHADGDGVRVALEVASDAPACVSLPGPFAPEEGAAEVAAPLYQGLLFRRGAGTWERRSTPGGHGGFSMGMLGVLGPRAGLLAAQEALAGWRGVCGAADGALAAHFEASSCPVDGWTGDHAVRLLPTDASLTALCKGYRAHLVARGEFASWDDKIARKPILDRLFGALVAFTGYNHAPGLDYAAEVRRLKAWGFRSLLLFPVRMCHYSRDFRMGGDAPVWLSDADIAAVKAVDGALAGPWGWVYEAIDDGTPARRALFRRGADGEPLPGWQIDDFRWHPVCPPFQREHIRRRFAGDMAAMDWIHFDVDASVPPAPCFAADHAAHGSAPLGRSADLRAVRDLFEPETVGDRIVSSEGFVGSFAAHYDIGTTKLMPGPRMGDVTLVPMTMLVYHDSCVHDWWELQNYNAVPGWPVGEFGDGWGLIGSGRPRLKAAVDALHGCPPNVFPFGRQYAWADRAAHATFSFQVSPDDPAVREALQAAVPVAALHARIGRLEMTDFAFLDAGRAVQATTFADGTRVVANLSGEPAEVEGGVLPPESWVAGAEARTPATLADPASGPGRPLPSPSREKDRG